MKNEAATAAEYLNMLHREELSGFGKCQETLPRDKRILRDMDVVNGFLAELGTGKLTLVIDNINNRFEVDNGSI